MCYCHWCPVSYKCIDQLYSDKNSQKFLNYVNKLRLSHQILVIMQEIRGEVASSLSRVAICQQIVRHQAGLRQERAEVSVPLPRLPQFTESLVLPRMI